MPRLTLGYKASAEQFHPQRLLDLAVAAEAGGVRLGLDQRPLPALAAHRRPCPQRARLAGRRHPGDAPGHPGHERPHPSFRYNPAIVAQAFATLSCLAPGRVILGVGTGESMNEVPVGVDWPEQKERFARLKEAVTLIGRLWREEFVDFKGEFFRTHEATIYDRPDTPVPIYIAASGPAAARLAGRIGDGFICTSGKGAELYTETLLPALAEGAAKADRDPAAMDKMIEMKVSFDPDLARAMEDTKEWSALALPGEMKVGVHDPRQMEILARHAEPYAHTRWLVSDDPDEHVEQIATYLGYGLNHLVFHFPGNDQEAAIDALRQGHPAEASRALRLIPRSLPVGHGCRPDAAAGTHGPWRAAGPRIPQSTHSAGTARRHRSPWCTATRLLG